MDYLPTCSSPPRAGRPSAQEGRASARLGSPAAQAEFLRLTRATGENRRLTSHFSLVPGVVSRTERNQNSFISLRI